MASVVWKYFKIEISNELFAKCYLCNKLISRGGGSKSTSNLMKHLKTHKIDLTKSNIRQASKSGILATPETSKN